MESPRMNTGRPVMRKSILIAVFTVLGSLSIAAVIGSMFFGVYDAAAIFVVGVGGSLAGLLGVAP